MLSPTEMPGELDVQLGTASVFDRVNARLLKGFAQLCAACGGDGGELLASVGIASLPTPDEPAELTYQQFVDVLSLASRVLNCPDFGMRLALSQAGTDLYGPLGSIMRHSRTLGDALEYVIDRADVHSRAARVLKHALPGRTAMVFSHEIMVGRFSNQDQAMEYILLAGHLGAVALTRGRARARQILLRHCQVSPMPVYRRYFGCEVLFDQLLDGLIFSQDDLASLVVGQDPRIHADLIEAVEARFTRHEPPIHAAARGAVLRLIHVGLASNEQVATDLGMHPRTLHRRLTRAGTTFQRIKDEVRCEFVRYYLVQTDVSFLWITGKLGFAEQAIFTRFCHRHFGLAPSELRKQALSMP